MVVRRLDKSPAWISFSRKLCGTKSMKDLFPSARGVWQLFWRSVVFLPVALVLLTLYCLFWLAVFALPIAMVALAVESLWLSAAGCFVAWIPLLWLTRWKRLHLDRRDTLNEYENV